jgi:hypothetical protein
LNRINLALGENEMAIHFQGFPVVDEAEVGSDFFKIYLNQIHAHTLFLFRSLEYLIKKLPKIIVN